ncbi:MAG: FtsQ-type POTRA domain-containing protein [Candidatus Gastranaerophilales bacterium]|nr:FtsQ-type POTRA domain-containing protein [Candidatus Gastranaerophilales bacterium]
MANDGQNIKHRTITVRSSKPLLFLRALIIALIIFSGYKILTSSKWYYPQNMFKSVKNTNFTIAGTYITPKEKILNVMKKTEMPKKPLYMIDVKAFEDMISEIETVKSVHVRRYWFPARLQIVVEDKKPVIMIASDENAKPAAFFVEGGVLLSADLLPANSELYPLKILTTGSDPKDNFINWKEDRINQLLELADKAALYSGEDVEYIDIRDLNNIFIKIKSVLIDLGEMNDGAYERLQTISAILPYLKDVDKKIEYVDLRWDVTKYIKYEGKEDDENGDNTVQSENG